MPAYDLWKYPWEEVFFYHQFRRTPKAGWLASGETIASVTSVTVFRDSGAMDDTKPTATGMVSGTPAPFESTKVKYKIIGGTVGEVYSIRIRIVSSTGQKFQDWATLEVK